jgi:acetate kinase
MLVVQTDPESRLIEIDRDLFEEVKEFLKKLSSQRKRTFSYIDEIGDRIVVIGGKEFVVPTRRDIEALHAEEEMIDEDEAKRLLGV